MGKKIAIGFVAMTLYAAPLDAEQAKTPAITKPNNDATLRPPHHSVPPAPLRTPPTINSAPPDDQRR